MPYQYVFAIQLNNVNAGDLLVLFYKLGRSAIQIDQNTLRANSHQIC